MWINFEEKYGTVGKRIIEVHHIKPLSEIGEEYIINPIEDLIPVCPNCHSVTHSRRPSYSTAELKAIVNNKKILSNEN